jgi:hypothetical protein
MRTWLGGDDRVPWRGPGAAPLASPSDQCPSFFIFSMRPFSRGSGGLAMAEYKFAEKLFILNNHLKGLLVRAHTVKQVCCLSIPSTARSARLFTPFFCFFGLDLRGGAAQLAQAQGAPREEPRGAHQVRRQEVPRHRGPRGWFQVPAAATDCFSSLISLSLFPFFLSFVFFLSFFLSFFRAAEQPVVCGARVSA